MGPEQAQQRNVLGPGPDRIGLGTRQDVSRRLVPRPTIESTTLGILINSRLKFQPHIDMRTKKVETLGTVMMRFGNSRGGLAVFDLSRFQLFSNRANGRKRSFSYRRTSG